LNCTKCGGDTKVTDTRKLIYRRRRCLACDFRFTTVETVMEEKADEPEPVKEEAAPEPAAPKISKAKEKAAAKLAARREIEKRREARRFDDWWGDPDNNFLPEG
jgi:transcriptional regulator NrdR family protein